MARKPLKTETESHAMADADMPGLPAAMENLALSADLEKDEILNAGIDLGRLDAMAFIATIADSAVLSIYENVKKTKAWRYLKSCDGRNFESLEQFCTEKLGRSYRRLQEVSANRNTLGQEAFEAAERIGLRQADYNLLKALPAPKQEIIKEALSEGATKEELQKAIRELAAADQKEIEALSKEKAEIQADYEAQAQVLADKNAKLDELAAKLEKVRKAPRNEQAAQALAQEKELLDRLMVSSQKLLGEIHEFAQVVADTLADPTEARMTAAETTVQWLFQRINEVAIAHQIPVDFAEMVNPSWAQDVLDKVKAGADEAETQGA
jgi:hypothetical protein